MYRSGAVTGFFHRYAELVECLFDPLQRPNISCDFFGHRLVHLGDEFHDGRFQHRKPPFRRLQALLQPLRAAG